MEIKTHNGNAIEWRNSIRELYQQSEPGTSHAHHFYYVYRNAPGDWRAGRLWFGQEIDFRMTFTSAKVARDYIAQYDRERVVIVAS